MLLMTENSCLAEKIRVDGLVVPARDRRQYHRVGWKRWPAAGQPSTGSVTADETAVAFAQHFSCAGSDLHLGVCGRTLGADTEVPSKRDVQRALKIAAA